MKDRDLETFQATWQTQSTEIKDIDMEAIMKNAQDLKKTIDRRNAFEWIASAALIPLFVMKVGTAPTLWSQIMYGELTLALIMISGILFHKGRFANVSDVGLSTEEYIQIQKQQLQKQIELLSKVRYWYVAPLCLGMLGLGLERVITNWNNNSIPWSNLVFLLALPPLAFGLIWLNEVRGVRDVRAKLEELSWVGMPSSITSMVYVCPNKS